MKNTTVLIIILQLLVYTAHSQQLQPPQTDYRQMAGKETDIITQRLGLDSQQKVQMAKVNEAYFKLFFEKRAQMDTTAQTRQVLKSNYDNRMAAYRKILTSAQFARYEQDIADIRQKVEKHNSDAKAKAMQLAKAHADSLRSMQPQPNH
jgi:hypothetical protein